MMTPETRATLAHHRIVPVGLELRDADRDEPGAILASAEVETLAAWLAARDLASTERRVLLAFAGMGPFGDLPWGGAVGQALECLRGSGILAGVNLTRHGWLVARECVR